MNPRNRFPFAFLAILAFGAALATPMPAPAEEITLAWDANPPPPEPGLNIRYRIEQNRPAPWADAGQWVQVATDIAGTTVTLPDISPGPVSYRAYAFIKEFPGIQSNPCPVLEAVSELPAPSGLRKVKVTLQTSTNLKEWKEIAAVTEDATAASFYRAQITLLPN